MIELKKYWIYLIVIILIILSLFYFQLWTISEGIEGSPTQAQRDIYIAMTLFWYDGILTALQDARNAHDTLTENAILYIPAINKGMNDIIASLDKVTPEDIIRVRAKMEDNRIKEQKRMQAEGGPATQQTMYLQLKEQLIRDKYEYHPITTTPIWASRNSPTSRALSILTPMGVASSPNLFDDNQTLYNSFKSYNTAYNTYAICVEPTYNAQSGTFDSSYNADLKTFSSTTCNAAALNVNSLYNTLISDISKAKDDTASMDRSQNLTSINDLKKNENNNRILRSELDLKLQDLYSIQESLPKMNQTSVDSTTFAFLLWTVLASSMLLYIFIPSPTV